MTFERGTVIAGKYRVERVIGEGGMGVVLAARHLGLDEMVAVKLIRAERVGTADALTRFQREARAVARIKSEHVARVLDVDRLATGEPYMVMELIDGADLHALLKRRGILPADEAASYIMQACEGVAEAHALGMVHRDLKLKNLFLTRRRDGRPLIKVIDFGVVKLLTGLDSDDDSTTRHAEDVLTTPTHDVQLTGTSMLVGSVHYMAPEQIRASNVVDPRADVWSLGVCLYALLTTELPFDGESIIQVCAAIQGRPVPNILELEPTIPPALAAVVERALEKDVKRRFANVGELAAALAPFTADRAAVGRIATILDSGVRIPGSSSPSFSETATSGEGGLEGGRIESTMDHAALGSLVSRGAEIIPWTKRNRWLVGSFVMLAAAIATTMIWSRARPQDPEPAPATQAAMPIVVAPPPPMPAAPPVLTIAAPPIAALPPPTPAPQRPAIAQPKRPLVPPPAPKKPTPPKGDSSSAYDKF